MSLDNTVVVLKNNKNKHLAVLKDDQEFVTQNGVIKFNDINDYFDNNPIYDFSNNLHYENLFQNLSPGFINAVDNDLRINQNSEIIGLGSLEFATQTPFDILNNNRTDSPDLGAYQYIIIED